MARSEDDESTERIENMNREIDQVGTGIHISYLISVVYPKKINYTKKNSLKRGFQTGPEVIIVALFMLVKSTGDRMLPQLSKKWRTERESLHKMSDSTGQHFGRGSDD